VETALFRIAQEALQNVAKHSAATSVHVALTATASGARLVVADDGRGFDVEREARRADAYGLAGMSERAALVGARVTVASTPGEGTTVTVDVPRGNGS
jgi:signal transduction histidine kinase